MMEIITSVLIQIMMMIMTNSKWKYIRKITRNFNYKTANRLWFVVSFPLLDFT